MLNDGTVKTWGSNENNRLGLGNISSASTPTTIPGLSNVKQIVANNYNGYALLNDGTVKAWGVNTYGQLGIGDTSSRTDIVLIPDLQGVREIRTCDTSQLDGTSVYALLEDGTVKSWGYNNYGLLGLGGTSAVYTPTTISGLSNVKQIVSGESYESIALLEDGTVKSWGSNTYGQLGVGSTTVKYTPTQISTTYLSNVKKIVKGSTNVYALLEDGTVKSWGNNTYGQLGVGDTVNKLNPTVVKLDAFLS